MSTRKEMITEFYDRSDENGRLEKSRHGQLEYAITMAYIHRFLNPGNRVLEVGAGTGRYSIALAKEGFDVSAVDLIRSYQGDATDLCLFDDDSFDMTLVLGPMYHLFAPEDVNRAIDEAIRVTKPGGTLHFAFLSIYALMYSNALYGIWAPYQEENFTKDFKVRHFQEQLFTGYDVCEFERLFDEKPVERVTTAAMDGPLEALEKRPDFFISDENFDAFVKWHLAFAEKRELLGGSNHLLYICQKTKR